jgi:hypothetical protein
MGATRTFVAPSRKARRATMIRTAVIAGAALGFLIAVFLFVGRGGNSNTTLATRPVTAKVLSPSVKYRASAGAVLGDLQSSDKLREKAVIETDPTGLGEFKYADGSIVRVGPSSNFSFTKTRSEGSKRDIASRLVTGKSWHRVTPGFGESSNYQVTVLGATGKVVGTSFATVCPIETDCFYTLVRGRLKVEDSANHTADLKAGDQVEVKFGRLDPVKHLTDEELAADPWITQNLTLDGDSAPAAVDETTTTIEGETTTTLPGETTLTSTGGALPTNVTTRGGATPPPPPPPPVSPGTTTATTQPSATTTPPTSPPTSPPSTSPPCHRNNGTWKPVGCNTSTTTG